MLANWFFFWDENDWSSTPSPSPAPDAPRSNAGGGKRRKGRSPREYQPASEEFWDVRARYLRRFVDPTLKTIEKQVAIEKDDEPPTTSSEPTIEASPAELSVGLTLLRQAFAAAAQRAAVAEDMAQLKIAAARLRDVALDISKIEQQYYDRAIALLLLDVF